MIKKCIVRKNEYHDSVVLMRITENIQKIEGVDKAAIVMATDNNKKLLEEMDLLTKDAKEASPNDLLIAIEVKKEEKLNEVMLKIDEFLTKRIQEIAEMGFPKSLESALEVLPDANLVIISVPGQFASFEAKKALEKNLNVFLFSDNVPLEDEIELKRLAYEKNLLLMGPEAGTAIINGVGLGFANVVDRGPIGIVGASGTGIQEVASIISRESGISQAIGVGGRDLSEEVGGIMTIEGIKALEDDGETKVIVVIAKSSTPKVQEKVLSVIKKCKKPIIVDFIGSDISIISSAGAIPALTLEGAAMKAVALIKGKKPKEIEFTLPKSEITSIINSESQRFTSSQKYVRGLFSGGSFCDEAMLIMNRWLSKIYSNVANKQKFRLEDPYTSIEHTCIDMGASPFTVGKPHPMIDFSLRKLRLLKEAKDPEVAVILLDVVLGYGAHQDPAGELAPIISQAKSIAQKDGRYLSVVASICGTIKDPQGFNMQKKKLKDVGVVVMPSNAQAARMAALIAIRSYAK
jgi:FdrA protein